MSSRIEILRGLLLQNGIDAVVISQSHNRRYLSGFTGSAGYLFISADHAILATDSRYIEQAADQATDFQIRRISGGFTNWLPAVAGQTGARVIGFESEDLTVAAHTELVKAVRKTPPRSRPRLRATKGIVESMRAEKDEDELRMIERAANLADSAIERAARSLRPGQSEKELAWELERFLRENGSETISFPIIVASGPNSARPHAEPSERIIGYGEPVIIDLGARIDGYCSDITRTLCVGEPGETFAQLYGLVRTARAAAIERLSAGMTGDQADAVARTVIEEGGHGDAFGHGLGHGVGLDVHEAPRLGPGSGDALRVGMVFTVEPGIYLEQWGGVRIEDMVILEEDGPRVLTQAAIPNLQEE